MHNTFPNKFYFINSFKKNNIDKLNINTGVIFRNYSKKVSIYEIIQTKKYCKKKGIKFFLSNNIKLSIKLGLDGSYIPSFNQSLRHLAYKTKSSFIIMGSAHNIREIEFKIKQGCENILLSKLFKVEYKPNSSYFGLIRFNIFSNFSKRIIPLGGINSSNFNNLKNLKSEGVAILSEIKKKPAIASRLF